MKKITAIVVLSLMLSSLLVFAYAAPSPTTAAKIGSLTVEIDGTSIEIPSEYSEDYLSILHVYEATEGTALYNIGLQLSDDSKISSVIGREYDGFKLVQLFSFVKTGKFYGSNLILSDYVLNDSGLYTVQNSRTVNVKDGKFTVNVYSPTFSEDSKVTLMKYDDGEWTKHGRFYAHDGYISITLTFEELDASWAVLFDKAPVSPPTGDTNNLFLFAGMLTVSIFALAWASKKYLAHN